MKHILFCCVLIGTVLLPKVSAQYVMVPDSFFRAYLMTYYPTCFNASQQMDTTCAGITGITALLVDGHNIWDLDGVQYLDGLTQLSCAYNQLTTLPKLPAGITVLDVRGNRLSALPALPPALYKLDCQSNQLTSLPPLPASLELLDCGRNLLGALPVLPPAMKFLDCGENNLTTLPSLPNTITTLRCDTNQLTVLPALPSALFLLDCSDNYLSSLPTLPAGINLLSARQNALTTLPALPASLQQLYCAHNQLTLLPALPPSLYTLDLIDNPIACLPPLPLTLATLQTYQTLITCIPNYTTYLISSNSPHPLCTSPCQVAGVNMVSGRVYADFDCDQQVDPGELNLNFVLMGLGGNVQSGLSSPSGLYSFPLPADTTAAFGPVSTIPGYGLQPATRTVTTDSVPQLYAGNDFFFCPDSTFDNFRVHVSELVPARPGFVVRYALTYENRGSQVQNAVLKFFYGNGQGAAETSPANVGGATVSGDTLIWTLANVPLFQPQMLLVEFLVDQSTPLGTTFLPSAYITPPVWANEIDTLDNRHEQPQMVVGSYDPNDKAVQHASVSPAVAQQGMDLTYTIRFQNTGTDTAFTVIVRDTLSDLLDIASLEMVGSSSPYSLLIQGNVLQWTFSRIHLVDSFRNEPASHGFLAFHIRSKPQTTLQEIGNRAAIYFDFNAPVITNTAFTAFTTGLHPVVAGSTLKLMPNPAKDQVQVTADASMHTFSVQVLDLTGREILTLRDQPNPARLPVASLPAGTYLVRVTGAQGTSVARLVKE